MILSDDFGKNKSNIRSQCSDRWVVVLELLKQCPAAEVSLPLLRGEKRKKKKNVNEITKMNGT